MTQSDPAIEARLQLIKITRASVYDALCRVAHGGHSAGDAVVLVADTSDALGRELAKTAREISSFNAHVQAPQVNGAVPIAIVALSLGDATSLFRMGHPSVAKGLERTPAEGCVRVVAVGAGTATLVHTDVRASTRIAEG